jgi:hypothetical protein
MTTRRRVFAAEAEDVEDSTLATRDLDDLLGTQASCRTIP